MIGCQCICILDTGNWAQVGLMFTADSQVHYNAASKGGGSVAVAHHHVALQPP